MALPLKDFEKLHLVPHIGIPSASFIDAQKLTLAGEPYGGVLLTLTVHGNLIASALFLFSENAVEDVEPELNEYVTAFLEETIKRLEKVAEE